MPRSGTSCPRARARLRRMRDAHMSGKGGRTAARRKKEREAIMRTRKRTAKAKVLLLACMAALTLGVAGLWGCASGDGQGDAKQGENTASESQEALEPVSVAYLNKAGYETVIVADKKGYFDVAPMDVELLTVSGSGQQSVRRSSQAPPISRPRARARWQTRSASTATTSWCSAARTATRTRRSSWRRRPWPVIRPSRPTTRRRTTRRR